MISIEQARELIDELNDQAHNDAWDLWTEADNAEDEADAGELREHASAAQQEYFTDLFHDLDDDTQADILNYCQHDTEFGEQFKCYYGDTDFDEEQE